MYNAKGEISYHTPNFKELGENIWSTINLSNLPGHWIPGDTLGEMESYLVIPKSLDGPKTQNVWY